MNHGHYGNPIKKRWGDGTGSAKMLTRFPNFRLQSDIIVPPLYRSRDSNSMADVVRPN